MKYSDYKEGMSKSIQKVVTKEDTAHYYGSGALEDLLATPALTALMINAAVSLIDPLLPDGYITIGRKLKVEHLQPTVKGMTVTVKATIYEINNNRIIFEIIAYDELSEIGRGKHERYIVKQDILIGKAQNRCKTVEAKPQ